MIDLQFSSREGDPIPEILVSTTKKLIIAVLLCEIALVNVQGGQQPERVKPTRFFTIQGQVSLPEGKPASRVLVTITTRTGTPRQVTTTEQGRFEFPNMEAGGYSLSARSLSDPNLTSESLDTDTSRTATNSLNVNLILKDGSAKNTRPGVVAVVEREQKVPKEARKAFNQGVKYRKDDERDKALESFGRSIELYPEYFQALSERGDLYVLQRKLNEAAADFDRALQIYAHYGPALRGAGYCKLEKREFAEAAENFERSLSAEPDNASAYLMLGIANLELDRRDLARQALQKALGLGAFRAHIYLGNLYAREHLYQDAANELHAYLEAQPQAAEAAKLKEIEAQWRVRAAAP